MLPFHNFSATVTDRRVPLRVVLSGTGRFPAVPHMPAGNWLRREVLIFESEACTSWCSLRI